MLWGHLALGNELVILHTNDHHGQFLKNELGEGGFAAQYSAVEKVRRENKHVLLLSSGDINTGRPASDLLYGTPDIVGMNLLKYDALTVGNHEFDLSWERLSEQRSLAHFPFLSANIYFKNCRPKKNCRVFTPYIIKNINGVKVAIFGLTTMETSVTADSTSIEKVEFSDPIIEAQHIVKQLKNKVDIIIALTHLGYYETTGESIYTSDTELAQKVHGIDYVFGGHSHTLIESPVKINNTLIVQSGSSSKYVGKMKIIFDGQRNIIKSDYNVIPINVRTDDSVDENGNPLSSLVAEKIEENSFVLSKMEPYETQTDKLLDIAIGYSQGLFDGERASIRSHQTQLGTLVTKSIAQRFNSDLAFVNGGGLRASIHKGDVKYRDILAIHPYQDTICTVNLKPEKVQLLLNYMRSIESGSGAFAQIYMASKFKSKMKNDELITVSSRCYLLKGKDGYPDFSTLPSFISTGYPLTNVLKETVLDLKILDPFHF